MTKEPKGITLKGLDEVLTSMSGTPLKTSVDGESVPLIRSIALMQALETYTDGKKEDKFKIFDLGLRLHNAVVSMDINVEESVLAQAAIEKAWPQSSVFASMCRWLEGA